MIRTNHKVRRLLSRWTIFLCAYFAGIVIASGQDNKRPREPENWPCTQDAKEHDVLIDEAESKQFNVMFVEFWGNTRTNSRELFKIIGPVIGEGDIFSRNSLDLAIKRVSKVRTLYPLTMSDVKIWLDRKNQSINVLFCLREKEKR